MSLSPKSEIIRNNKYQQVKHQQTFRDLEEYSQMFHVNSPKVDIVTRGKQRVAMSWRQYIV